MRRVTWLVALLAACGGKAVIDDVGSGAGAGSTGSGATAPVPTSTAPPVPPDPGPDDPPPGVGGCGPGTGVCPSDAPVDGESCQCEAGLKCAYDQCSKNGTTTAATCDGTRWSVTVDMCAQPLCPNGFLCALGEVCLEVSTGFMVTWGCAANPCVNQPLDCSCAAPLCGDSGDFACVQTTTDLVRCECISC
jgi:hypothetical protein